MAIVSAKGSGGGGGGHPGGGGGHPGGGGSSKGGGPGTTSGTSGSSATRHVKFVTGTVVLVYIMGGDGIMTERTSDECPIPYCTIPDEFRCCTEEERNQYLD